ncbi:GNAT family N-acetyltransferase [Thermococcus sp. GR7]|uniref:GNAT family N-acetyltransferase n=1 Tax=unclassified Thermococcus TaxID=2627626 RepID=UPI00142F973E|nr:MULTISPECIES: GNAT family N-acetyltransferase [unclassified Thermococcus]NJE46588.1 GNAT family N-acetyltransferase [Thermococcus sp. GR7]NJE79059.1 GNAT family N-acetyltransferase [Thermococcus sp. GR4]NJF23581.1 GNAT family N-acetyltransferase [Thermococcus sp. GR5]
MILRGRVVGSEIPRFKHRWFGILEVETEEGKFRLYMTGNVAQWFLTGDEVEIKVKEKPQEENGVKVLNFDDYELYKFYSGDKIKAWPLWEKEVEAKRFSPLTGELLYTYKLRAREAKYESDFEAIAELEQYHYASQKETVALWRCKNGHIFEANTKQKCPVCGTESHILEIKGSTPASRFLLLELVEREEYEPRILAYVRIDPPIPLMHRLLPNGEIERNIREKVFPGDWFHPAFWPEKIMKELYEELKRNHGRKVARSLLWEEAKWRALKETNTAGARIARVVVHPDYRSDGLGQLSVRAALEWIAERRVPEMRKRKHIVETIAQMARYNPFFEKVGFKFLWETASGRPVLFYPLTEEAKEYIERFLHKDPYAPEDGRLWRPSYGKVEPLSGPIVFKNVSKVFESELDVKGLPEEIQELLKAFGVRHRVIQRPVLRNLNFEINPGELIAVVGASGAGKTTLLRLILGAAKGYWEEKYRPSEGEISVPENVKVSVLIPGEFEPSFGSESILEHVYRKIRDLNAAVEVLNRAGLSDAVLYRAKFGELSTGQKERAKIASLLAEKPNLLLMDEFAAHLDTLTAMRVAKKVAEIIREAGITALIITHRPEVLRALDPDKVLFVGYGTARVEAKGKSREEGRKSA